MMYSTWEITLLIGGAVDNMPALLGTHCQLQQPGHIL